VLDALHEPALRKAALGLDPLDAEAPDGLTIDDLGVMDPIFVLKLKLQTKTPQGAPDAQLSALQVPPARERAHPPHRVMH
jgi:hypothetical protein